MNKKQPPVFSLPLVIILSNFSEESQKSLLCLAAHLNIRHQCGFRSRWFREERKGLFWFLKVRQCSHHTCRWCGCCAGDDPQQVDSVSPPISIPPTSRSPQQNLLPRWSVQSSVFSFHLSPSHFFSFLVTLSIFPLCTLWSFTQKPCKQFPLSSLPMLELWVLIQRADSICSQGETPAK